MIQIGKPTKAKYTSEVRKNGAYEALEGRYKILNFIGKGGYGQVFQAVDLVTREKVAIKLVSGLQSC